MNAVYKIDGLPLNQGEEEKHQQFLNASLLGQLSAYANSSTEVHSVKSHAEAVARDSFTYADAMIREYRNRTKSEEANKRYRLCDDSAKVDAFLDREGMRRPSEALVVMKMQQTPLDEMGLDEIRAFSGVTEQTVRSLINAGILEESIDEA